MEAKSFTDLSFVAYSGKFKTGRMETRTPFGVKVTFWVDEIEFPTEQALIEHLKETNSEFKAKFFPPEKKETI